MKLPELLAPAGNYEKMLAAFRYGADAVYLAGEDFGMRSAAKNFSLDEISRAVNYAHSIGKKVYLTVNTMPHEMQYPALREFFLALRSCPPDGLIISDMGVFALAEEILPDTDRHVSTQASTVSSAACNAWYKLGARRIVLAREVSLEEIIEIRKNIPEDLELEAFVHGSMCISHSGRCLLSNYLTGRDANRGACTQPCRWNFVISEEKRMNIKLPVYEDDGTFIMASKDMCMIEHIPELVESGISSLKIEGRMKSSYYAAVTSNTYRMALDAYKKDPEGYKFDPLWSNELDSVSHREYATGYYFTSPAEEANVVSEGGYLREKAYFAEATGLIDENGYAEFMQRNKVSVGDAAELLVPGETGKAFTIENMLDAEGNEILSAPHPMQRFWIRVPFEVKEGYIIRGGGSDK